MNNRRAEQAASELSYQFRDEVTNCPENYSQKLLAMGKEIFLDSYDGYIAGLYNKRQERREAIIKKWIVGENDPDFANLLQNPNVLFYLSSCMVAGNTDARGKDGISSATNSVRRLDTNKLNIAVGKDNTGEDVFIDFSKHHFMLLTGETGSGKSIFHYYLYKQLVEQNTSQEIGFIFLDMTRVDFGGWKSPYVIANVQDSMEAIELLEILAETKGNDNKHIFIHIEECDMFYQGADRVEGAIKSLIENRPDVTLVYSTSRPAPDSVLRESLLSMIDVKVVFKLSTTEDLNYVLARVTPYMPKQWEKIVEHNGTTVFLQPYSEVELQSLQNFKLD